MSPFLRFKVVIDVVPINLMTSVEGRPLPLSLTALKSSSNERISRILVFREPAVHLFSTCSLFRPALEDMANVILLVAIIES